MYFTDVQNETLLLNFKTLVVCNMCRINFNTRRGENVQSNDTISQLENISKTTNLVKLLSVTPGAEEVISYCARVSNPNNQLNFNNSAKLILYLIKNKH